MPRSTLDSVLKSFRPICGLIYRSIHWRILWSLFKPRFFALRQRLFRRTPSAGKLPESAVLRKPHTGVVTHTNATDIIPHRGFSFQSTSQCSDHPEARSECRDSQLYPIERHGSKSNLNAVNGIEKLGFDCGSQPNLPAAAEEEVDSGTRGTDILHPMDLPLSLKPIWPEALRRYETKKIISLDPSTYTVKALQTEFDSVGELPPGWVRFTHPEGQVFFYNKEKKIVTDTWLYEEELCEQIIGFVEMFENYIKTNQIVIPEYSELVLEFENEEPNCRYYFADPTTRCIFWLQDFCIEDCLQEVSGGELAPGHVKVQLELQYWKHFEYFESIQTVSPSLLREIKEIVLNAWGDSITSTSSTVNHSPRKLSAMKEILEAVASDPSPDSRGCAWLVGKFMSQFYQERFINWYGQQTPRLFRYQSIYGEPLEGRKRTWLIRILSPILFYAPNIHLLTLEKIWVDRITAEEPWIHLVGKLTEEWTQHTTFAAILLNANVAFLAIPSIIASQPLDQTLSYVSIVLCVGSIILGLLLGRQHRTKHAWAHVTEAQEFLASRHHEGRGFEATAILYSLPYVLLMYAMLSFLASFLFSCLWSTPLVTRLGVGLSWMFTSMLILWCLWVSWEAKSKEWPEQTVFASWLSTFWRCGFSVRSIQAEEGQELDSEVKSGSDVVVSDCESGVEWDNRADEVKISASGTVDGDSYLGRVKGVSVRSGSSLSAAERMA